MVFVIVFVLVLGQCLYTSKDTKKNKNTKVFKRKPEEKKGDKKHEKTNVQNQKNINQRTHKPLRNRLHERRPILPTNQIMQRRPRNRKQNS